MITLAINAISVKEGGSFVVLNELVQRLGQIRRQWDIHVFANSAVAKQLQKWPVKVRTFPSIDAASWRTRCWYEHGLIRVLNEIRADVLFSQTNYLPWRSVGCKTVLLQQHAGHFSAEFDKLSRQHMQLTQYFAWRSKRRWVRRSLRAADAVTVQTNALAEAIVEDMNIDPAKIWVIPHGCGQSEEVAIEATVKDQSYFHVGYTTKFGVQKNFNVLFRAIADLRERGIPIRLSLTLDESIADNRRVLRCIHDLGINDAIVNHGELTAQQLSTLYPTFDAFVFPSLCESFGFPLVEAMNHRLPIVVARTSSNMEIAGAAGIAFHPHDYRELAAHLERLAIDEVLRNDRIAASARRAKDFSWARATEMTAEMIESVVSGSQK